MRLIRYVIVGIMLLITSLVPVNPAQGSGLPGFNIVALGDSFTSGNGALDYYEEGCYRSHHAYVHQYANSIDNHVEPRVSNLACHGALTSHIEEQINADIQSVRDADVIFVTIGGNDGLFLQVAIDCLVPFASDTLKCVDQLNHSEQRLGVVGDAVSSALHDIADANSRARIVLIGYPYLIGSGCHPEGDMVRALQSIADARFADVVSQVDSARNASFRYESMLGHFAGGSVCDSGPQLIRGTADTFNVNEWWHPNREGHARIASVLHGMDLHSGVVDQSPQPQPLPIGRDGQRTYADLPFKCGVVVPYASTYDEYSGIVHGHALDFPMPEGTSVIAPEGGVAYVFNDGDGYGKYVDMHGESGKIHRLAHLQHTSIPSGQTVRRGERLGFVGSTGFTTSPHLHYEQRTTSSQVAINLGGPSLSWNVSSGFRVTTHNLMSDNCGSDSGLVQGVRWNGVPSGAKYKGDRLDRGESLVRGEYIASDNLRTVLYFQHDGNVVLAADGYVVWQTGTNGTGANLVSFQFDGNFVVYAGTTPVWTPIDLDDDPAAPDAYRASTSTAHLAVKNDGNLVAYNVDPPSSSSNPFWWHSRTYGMAREPVNIGDDQLLPGQRLNTNHYIHNMSTSSPHALLLQADGNLVVYGPGYHVKWDAGTNNPYVSHLQVQHDGNVVVYCSPSCNGSGWAWQSGTSGEHGRGVFLRLGNDGNLVVYDPSQGNTVLWARTISSGIRAW